MCLSIPLSPGYPSLPGCPGMPFSPLSPLLPGGPGGPGGPGSPGFNLSSQTGTGFLACSWMNESNFNTWAEKARQKMNVSLAGRFRKETKIKGCCLKRHLKRSASAKKLSVQTEKARSWRGRWAAESWLCCLTFGKPLLLFVHHSTGALPKMPRLKRNQHKSPKE